MPAIKPNSIWSAVGIGLKPTSPKRALWQMRSKTVIALLLLGASFVAQAYPPAPYHLVYGLVRDQYGTPIMNPQVQVVLQSPSGAVNSTTITPGLAVGVNYEIRVPMDTGDAPSIYRTNAAAPYSMFVVVGGITNVPIEAAAISSQLGQPAQLTRIDLTLGVDSNGDGIPDAWEMAFLASIGSNLSLADLNAGLDLTGDGRTLMQEYLLGSALFDPGTPFAARIVSFNNGAPVLEFPTMTGRSYTILGSPDLQQWTPLSFRLVADGPNGTILTNYSATIIETLQVQIIPPSSPLPAQFFRIELQ